MLIVGDLHFNDSKQFSTYEDGCNSRLLEQLDIMCEIRETCIERGIDEVVFVGDIFHVRGRVKPSVLNPVMMAFKDLANIARVSIIAGNHDMEDEAGVYTSIEPLKYINGIDVYTMPETCTIDGYSCGMIPYVKDRDEWLSVVKDMNVDILFTHHGIVNKGNGYGDKSEVELDKLKELGYKDKYIFNGHYHHAWSDGKFYNCGSAMGRSFSDADSPKYMYIFENGNIESIRLYISEFITFDYEGESENYEKMFGRYVNMRCTKDNINSATELANKYDAKGVVISLKPEEARKRASNRNEYNIEQMIINRINACERPDRLMDKFREMDGEI